MSDEDRAIIKMFLEALAKLATRVEKLEQLFEIHTGQADEPDKAG